MVPLHLLSIVRYEKHRGQETPLLIILLLCDVIETLKILHPTYERVLSDTRGKTRANENMYAVLHIILIIPERNNKHKIDNKLQYMRKLGYNIK